VLTETFTWGVSIPITVEGRHRTLISKGPGGTERRRSKGPFEIIFKTSLPLPSVADALDVWAFYMARQGAFEAFYWSDPLCKVGTVSVTNGSPVVTGTGTKFKATAIKGDFFKVAGEGTKYEIQSVDSDTQLTLTSNYTGSTQSGKEHEIIRLVRFTSDNLTREYFTAQFYRVPISFTRVDS
jgi:phage-related protein